MEEVLDIYKRPYDQDYRVVCMDEFPKQLISESRSSISMKIGKEARLDYEYVRHGMVNIFMANEALKGKRMVEVSEFKKNRAGPDVSEELPMRCTRTRKKTA